MEPRWKKKISEFLEMIPPLRGGDFQGIAGLSSDDSLLVGVSTARERSFKKAPALSNIGSMSPARLSLSTVASPHGRLLFYLASKSLAGKTTKVVRASQNQASVITRRGWNSRYRSPAGVVPNERGRCNPHRCYRSGNARSGIQRTRPDLSRFPTEKQFVSHLTLAPHVPTSGG